MTKGRSVPPRRVGRTMEVQREMLPVRVLAWGVRVIKGHLGRR
jgi:hypothetical protein